MKKTFLDISKALQGYAKEHGAQQDPVSKKWFVVGEVPMALLNFTPQVRRQAIPEYGPSCPQCGASTRKRFANSTRDPFWGCSRYPACKAIMNWNYADAKQILASASDAPMWHADSPKTVPPPSMPTNETLLLHQHWEEIIALAVEQLGSEKAVNRWLEIPKMAFSGETPIKVMTTPHGCERVKELLKALSD